VKNCRLKFIQKFAGKIFCFLCVKQLILNGKTVILIFKKLRLHESLSMPQNLM